MGNAYRNEWKYLISLSEAEHLRHRLIPFMQIDPFAGENGYMIRSLYFDDWKQSAYAEKMMGVLQRTKWRVRIYNFSDDVIKLERKKKFGNYIQKDSAPITRDDFERILDRDFDFLLLKENQLCREFYFECTAKLLRPKVIVDYDRIPMILDEGTVRITFDRDVRAAAGSFDIFDRDLPTFDCLEPGKLVLEVKYTEFLPQLLRQLLPLHGQEFTALSKYTICCDQVHHLTDPLFKAAVSQKPERIRDEYLPPRRWIR